MLHIYKVYDSHTLYSVYCIQYYNIDEQVGVTELYIDTFCFKNLVYIL